MRIRLDLHVRLESERWAQAAGSDPADAARDAAWYLSDAEGCIPHLGEDGCPAHLELPHDWDVDQDLLGAVSLRAPWLISCTASDWIAWRADPGPYLQAHRVPQGRAREDLTRVVVEGLVGMGLLAETKAVVTVNRPWSQVYDHHWRTHPRERPRHPTIHRW